MSPSVAGSLTTNLSFGDRPVCCPVSATIGPSAASTASPRRTAISISRAGGRFQYTVSAPVIPCLSTPKLLTTGPSFFIPHLGSSVCSLRSRRSLRNQIIDQEPRHDADAHRHRAVVAAERRRVQPARRRARLEDAEPVVEPGDLVG